jgi:hypothetical protein
MENEINYQNFTVIDFTMNESFFNWAWQPDERSEKFWKGWLEQHPHKREEVEEARGLILSLKELMGILNLGADPPAAFQSKTQREFKNLMNRINKINGGRPALTHHKNQMKRGDNEEKN